MDEGDDVKVTRRGLMPWPGRRRDARLLIVATEDRYAAKQYLEALQERGLIDRSRVHIEVLPTTDTRSSPAQVLDRLVAFQVDELGVLDRRWLVLDVDRWTPAMLGEVCREAIRKDIGLAISNPCIEAWFLLHFEEGVPEPPCQRSEELLRAILGGYDKTHIPAEAWTAERVARACQRGRESDTGARWPASAGSHMHRLLEAAGFRQAT